MQLNLLFARPPVIGAALVKRPRPIRSLLGDLNATGSAVCGATREAVTRCRRPFLRLSAC